MRWITFLHIFFKHYTHNSYFARRFLYSRFYEAFFIFQNEEQDVHNSWSMLIFLRIFQALMDFC